MFREDKRRQEIIELTSNGRIPHEVELEKHPEKSLEGRMCKWSALNHPTHDSLTHTFILQG